MVHAGRAVECGERLTNIPAQTMSILTNAELIAVDQDPAGEQGVHCPARHKPNLGKIARNRFYDQSRGPVESEHQRLHDHSQLD